MGHSGDSPVHGGGRAGKTPTRRPRLDEAADHDCLPLVPTTALGRAERLGGRRDRQLARCAEHMGEGLLAASVAVGLDVMAELIDAEVTDLVGPRPSTTPLGPPSATAARTPW
jgi:hypothetical protein